MTELSLHILDIAQNSVSANATLIEINIEENEQADFIRIEIADNGRGMDEEFLKTVLDPFQTTRTTRRVGMGLSLFKAAAESCGGSLEISSKPGIGTRVAAVFKRNHIDRQPIGDIAGTMKGLVLSSPEIDFILRYTFHDQEFVFDTKEVKNVVGEDISEPEVILWIGDFIKEGISELRTSG